MVERDKDRGVRLKSDVPWCPRRLRSRSSNSPRHVNRVHRPFPGCTLDLTNPAYTLGPVWEHFTLNQVTSHDSSHDRCSKYVDNSDIDKQLLEHTTARGDGGMSYLLQTNTPDHLMFSWV